uniref:Zymogen granule membrane protein 16 isoform X2 n=1 Tax=Geotrypetes seraphini TaxID=260995 RepID=A0A6P8PHC5_GEOSA|nr:zymogen granule membrane protein 16 isoform X2 [Geotrypetes seraphini]
MPRMLLLMVFSLLTDCGSSNEIQPRALSFEREYGSGSGVAFSSSSQQVYGPITAVQIYETSSYISGYGFQNYLKATFHKQVTPELGLDLARAGPIMAVQVAHE